MKIINENELRQLGQNIRLVVCDMDGTLLNSQNIVSDETLEVVKEIRKKGIFFTICTGRIYPTARSYAELLGIEGLAITANGALVVDTRTGEAVQKQTVDPAHVNKILKFFGSGGFAYIVQASEVCWYRANSNRVAVYEGYNRIALARGLPAIALRVADYNNPPPSWGEVHKVLIAGLTQEDQKTAAAYVDTLGNLSYTSSGPGLLEIMGPGATKGEGIRFLTKHLGLEKENVCVFGDYLNDISMFEEAGLSIAMANAEEQVKERALTVTASNDEDGVAQAIRKYIL
jgi:Cof subfamily protein (haloacid dehalogenase superfamily)